jgi:low affinity Fe/Cu permease
MAKMFLLADIEKKDKAAHHGSPITHQNPRRRIRFCIAVRHNNRARWRFFEMTLNEMFRVFSNWSAAALGSPWVFVANIFLVFLWLVSGPIFHYSDTWQLLINTATTVITYLAVFLIQNTQNRDAKAMHLKLDELITSIEGARNRFVDLENLSEDELATIQAQFEKLKERAQNGDISAVEAVVDDIHEDVQDIKDDIRDARAK